MKEKVLCSLVLVVLLFGEDVRTLSFPGPRVYVVTPSPRPPRTDGARAAPFYYHNWMRRMDAPNETVTTTTTPKVKTPDLIFAEFETDHMKNIRKLLEKERIETKTSTVAAPIYVPDEEMQQPDYGLHSQSSENKEQEEKKDMTDYFALYNNMYENQNSLPATVYLPSTLPHTVPTMKPTTTSTTASPVNNVENVWHIIDSEKHESYPSQWDEVYSAKAGSENNAEDHTKASDTKMGDHDDSFQIGENFALPGFATNPGSGAENESRAIRMEPNNRFPYVNLKPYQMKNFKTPHNALVNSKKGNNMYTSLDNFFDIKNPVRGEAQDVVPSVRLPVDRYNPAQPYLPQPAYGSKSKQSSPISKPTKAIANLVPPPPPPPPRVTGDDFPAPISYDSFPPYSIPDAGPPSPPLPAPPASSPVTNYQPPMDMDDNSDASGPDDNSGPPMDTSYQYLGPPPPPPQKFLPTLPPLTKPLGGYSYNKPPMDDDSGDDDSPPPMDKPDFSGYHYDKPPPPPPPPKPFKPDYYGYHYDKPEPPSPPADTLPPSMDHPPSDHGYGPHGPPSYGHDSDYPELIYNKPHGMPDAPDMGGSDMKGGGGMKGGDDDMGMVPPPPDMTKPGMDAPDDHGFPHDFPGDFDDHDYHHYHHHHTTTTTTTTTTEMPRVNRYSYYYLGKKLYYLPLYFSVYFIIYVGALIIKAVLRHKIVYPNSWRPNDDTASFFSKRSVDSWNLSNENLHEMTGKVTHAIATAADKYIKDKQSKEE